MSLMLSMIGEQPVPNLLPIRHYRPLEAVFFHTHLTTDVSERLKALVEGDRERPCSVRLANVQNPYDYRSIRSLLESVVGQQRDLLVNLTGGTKTMAFAAYSHSIAVGATAFYLQSEGNKAIIHEYTMRDGEIHGERSILLPELLTIQDYLMAHVPGYDVRGSSDKDGGVFERAVASALENEGIEFLAGVRPRGVKEQIEIDLVFRKGNNAGIAEVKMGRSKEQQIEGPKRGIDQLSTVGAREYFGTYVKKFLITSFPLNQQITFLADKLGINVVPLLNWRHGDTLPRQDAENLLKRIEIVFR